MTFEQWEKKVSERAELRLKDKNLKRYRLECAQRGAVSDAIPVDIALRFSEVQSRLRASRAASHGFPDHSVSVRNDESSQDTS